MLAGRSAESLRSFAFDRISAFGSKTRLWHLTNVPLARIVGISDLCRCSPSTRILETAIAERIHSTVKSPQESSRRLLNSTSLLVPQGSPNSQESWQHPTVSRSPIERSEPLTRLVRPAHRRSPTSAILDFVLLFFRGDCPSVATPQSKVGFIIPVALLL